MPRGAAPSRSASPVQGDTQNGPSPLSSALDDVKQGTIQTAQALGQGAQVGANVWKNTAQGLGKIPFKLGGTVADIGLGVTGQQPLKPFNVPGLGSVSTYARQAVDSAANPDSIFYNKPVLSGINSVGQGTLDAALAGGLAKSVVNEPGGFAYDSSKGSYGSLNQQGMRNANGGLNLMDNSPAIPQGAPASGYGGQTLYRGEGAGNTGGLHFTTDPAWAKNFGSNTVTGTLPKDARIYNLTGADMENAYKNGIYNEGDLWKSIFQKGYDAIAGHDAMNSSVPDLIVNPALRSTFTSAPSAAAPVTAAAKAVSPTQSLMSQLDGIAAKNLNPFSAGAAMPAAIGGLGSALKGLLGGKKK